MNERIEQVLIKMPDSIASTLKAIINEANYDATISKSQFQSLLEASGLTDQELRLALLPLAATYAHVPLSDFYVGAIARGLSGRLYFGANVEMSGVQLGQTVHAEQAAISHAWMKGEEGLIDVTVNFSPCGHCRQFMNELTTAKDLMIQLPEREALSLHTYLPDSFGPADLGVTEGLMTKVDKGVTSDSSDELIQQAVHALNMSHSPYTKNHSGVAIRTTDGVIVRGSYAENAAFNPSLPPLQVALVQVLLTGKTFADIESVALVEMLESSMSHLIDTQGTMEAISPDVPVEYVAY